MKTIAIAAILVLIGPVAAMAAPKPTPQQLGEIIGSEKACALNFDKSGIEAFIVKNVPANDLDFTTKLETSTWLTGLKLDKMGNTQLAAHCFQIKRSAGALGPLAK
jgi:hypothetical protein